MECYTLLFLLKYHGPHFTVSLVAVCKRLKGNEICFHLVNKIALSIQVRKLHCV